MSAALPAPSALERPQIRHPRRPERHDGHVGLCVLVQFPDVPGTIPRSEVEKFCNQPGRLREQRPGLAVAGWLTMLGIVISAWVERQRELRARAGGAW